MHYIDRLFIWTFIAINGLAMCIVFISFLGVGFAESEAAANALVLQNLVTLVVLGLGIQWMLQKRWIGFLSVPVALILLGQAFAWYYSGYLYGIVAAVVGVIYIVALILNSGSNSDTLDRSDSSVGQS